MLDRGQKLIAAIIGLGSIGGSVAGAAIWAGGRASAAEVQLHDVRISKLEAQRADEIDWRHYLVEQVGHIAARVGAPIVQPPEQSK